jgi:hypothetical protein
MNPDAARILSRLGACQPGFEWAHQMDSPRAAWEACGNPGWLAWAVGAASIPLPLELFATAAALRYLAGGTGRDVRRVARRVAHLLERIARGERVPDAAFARAYALCADMAAEASGGQMPQMDLEVVESSWSLAGMAKVIGESDTQGRDARKPSESLLAIATDAADVAGFELDDALLCALIRRLVPWGVIRDGLLARCKTLRIPATAALLEGGR